MYFEIKERKSIFIQAKIMCWQLQVAAQNLASLSQALVIICFLPGPNISEEPEYE